MARFLFLSCDFSFWHCTTMLVGRWVMRTAELVRFTCWPPEPLARNTSMRRSSSLMSISMFVSMSGYTSTEAKAVCLRPDPSKGEMRMRRWMPASPLSKP